MLFLPTSAATERDQNQVYLHLVVYSEYSAIFTRNYVTIGTWALKECAFVSTACVLNERSRRQHEIARINGIFRALGLKSTSTQSVPPSHYTLRSLGTRAHLQAR